MYCPACHAEYPDDWKVCPKDTTGLLKSPQIGKYAIEGLLGVGGMGAVYRAINPDTRGRVAVKVMNASVANADEARQRFQREAAAIAGLRTAHVVKVYDFGSEPDGTLYLVMELLDGHPLREEIRPGPDYMDLARVQLVMEGALKGLAAAHRAGIVHRDLKPENIYVADTDDGEVPKLLDFGIARVHTKDAHLTRTGHLMGTAAYMASEQVAANAGDIGPWTDVYAMGAILYEMLAGAPAYSGATVTEVLSRVLAGDAVPLATVRPELPDGIHALVERCMHAQPVQRPQDAEAMRLAMHASRLVPLGSQVPPPHRTRAVTGVEPTAGAVSVRAPTVDTGSVRPMPVASATAPTGPAVGATGPAMPPPAARGGPATAGGTVVPGTKPRWPLAVAGVAAVAIAAFLIVRATRGSSSDEPADAARAKVKRDGAAIAIDAPPAAIDAAGALPAVVDAGGLDPRDAAQAPEPHDAAFEDAGRAPPDAAPKPKPRPKAKPEECDIDELQRQARAQAGTGQDAAALATAETLLRCGGGNERAASNLAALAACRLGDAAKARKHFANAGPGRRPAIRAICQRNGITLP